MADNNNNSSSPVKPFPAITGGCACSAVRFKLLTAPLFCFACHCISCQKRTGSAFSLHLQIEFFNIRLLTATRPSLVPRTSISRPGEQPLECATCRTSLWIANFCGWEGICDVKVGVLDFPSLMEPDVHCYVESKLDWIVLPEGARKVEGQFGRELWPKSSHRRVEFMRVKLAEAKKRAAAQKGAGAEAGNRDGQVVDGEGGAEGDKTPTAVEFGEDEDADGEDDEAFEKRYKETERALRERLERLTMKLEKEDHDQAKKMESATTTTTTSCD